MQTISSKNSLILWENTQNSSNIMPINAKLYLKDNYVNVFRTVETMLKDTTKQYISMVTLWNDVIEKEIAIIQQKLKTFAKDKEAIVRVTTKFRGNCGEIFAEAFFTNGYGADICNTTSYVPVDPHKERFVDATGVSSVDGLPIGIQVKNYKEHNLVPHEIFMKASAENSLWLQHDKKIAAQDVAMFLASPHQIIFAFSDARDLFNELYSGVVVFKGKAYIDSKKLQGSVKEGLPGKWMFFKNIADEIEKVA